MPHEVAGRSGVREDRRAEARNQIHCRGSRRRGSCARIGPVVTSSAGLCGPCCGRASFSSCWAASPSRPSPRRTGRHPTIARFAPSSPRSGPSLRNAASRAELLIALSRASLSTGNSSPSRTGRPNSSCRSGTISPRPFHPRASGAAARRRRRTTPGSRRRPLPSASTRESSWASGVSRPTSGSSPARTM